MRYSTVCLLAATLLTQPTTLIDAAHPLVHLQTDRPAYRLGETIWYRAHLDTTSRLFAESADRSLTVRLLGPAGQELDTIPHRIDRASVNDTFAGSLSIAEEYTGGTFFVQARLDGRLAHEIPIEVYDLDLPDLDLQLEILGEHHYPGDVVRASFRALDLDGRPIANTTVEYLATFGDIRIRGAASKTDADGRALLRLRIPEETIESGYLSIGVMTRGKQAAIARPVRISSSVSRIDAFPEGGTLLEGHPHRVALLVRDLDGVPTAASGRIVNQSGKTVANFHADSRGIASIVLPGDEGDAYDAVVDRPTGVETVFAMPEPTSHPVSIFVEPSKDDLKVEIRGTRKMRGKTVEVILSTRTMSSTRQTVTLVSRDRSRLPSAQVTLPQIGENGVGHIIVTRGERALIKRPVFFHAPRAIDVELIPHGAVSPTVGHTSSFIVLTKLGNQPVSTDLALSLFRGDASSVAPLTLRTAIEPVLPEGVFAPVDFLAGGIDEDANHDRRDAFLLVYNSYRFPDGGAKLEQNGLPAPRSGRAAIKSVAPRAGTQRESLAFARRLDLSSNTARPKSKQTVKGKTIVRASGFERLLARAHFTRSARPKNTPHRFDLRVPERKLLAARKAVAQKSTLPQKQRVAASKIDARGTLFWSERVRTDQHGKALIEVRLSDLVGEVTWVAQGRSGERVASQTGSIQTSAGFKTDITTPKHLHVGDRFDLMVSTVVTDGDKKPVDVRIEAPSCLRAITQTSFRFDPRVDPRLRRLRFEVVKPHRSAELRIYADRGRYREQHVREFDVLTRTVEKRLGKAGRTHASETFATRVPDDALEGSVRVYGSVLPGYIATMQDWFRRRLREPHGCFEQYTNGNIANLLTLDALLEDGRDYALIEQAYKLSRTGFDRIISYCDPESGGFRLFPDQKPTVACTLVGLRHLALYAKLFDGLGRPQLERALYWLEQQPRIGTLEALNLTTSLHDLGRSWEGARRASLAKVRDPYLLALQAYALATWPMAATVRETEAQARARKEQLSARIERLQGLVRSPDRAVIHWGEDLQHTRGGPLSVSVIALTALALDAMDQKPAAHGLLENLADAFYSHGRHTSGSFALIAFSRLTEPSGESRLRVKFESTPGGSKHVTTLPGSTRTVEYSRGVDVKPGQKLAVAVNVKGDRPLEYRVGCSYLSTRPTASRDAPFQLTTRITPVVNMHNEASISATISPRGGRSRTRSQVVARIGIPGGCTVEDSWVLAIRRKLGGRGHCEQSNGFLDIYFNDPPRAGESFDFKIVANVAGDFRAQPSYVYPYYESGRTFYAEPLALKVVNTFEKTLDEASQHVGGQLLRGR